MEKIKMKLFLNKNRNKNAVNKDSFLDIEVDNSSRLLPIDNVVGTLDEYKQYLAEKKKSETYRLSFTINPICSNILFNNVSEIVVNEGSEKCAWIVNDNGEKNTLGNDKVWSENENVSKYLTNIKNDFIKDAKNLIKDTSFSHEKIGNFTYHCGYDIFNNHLLRKKEYGIINKTLVSASTFNTIEDFLRDDKGEIVKFNKDDFSENNEKNNFSKETQAHVYQYDTIYSFEESINENLIEENGWFGFINQTAIEIPNYEDICLNKPINNKKACEMVDMYPDRTLFSFIPKVNEYRKRIEPNWDYCLTYPAENFYENELVQYKDKNTLINGIETYIDGELTSSVVDDLLDSNEVIRFKTNIKHSLTPNSMVMLYFIAETSSGTTVESLSYAERVINVGKDGKDKEYFFTINGENVAQALNLLNIENYNDIKIRLRKVVNGGECQYYFRKFKKIPGKIKSNINKMGFSKTIYSDDVAQILFNDDIKLGNYRDNLGRKVSEIYLTIVKNNKGNKEWYDNKNVTSSTITYSHCFGEVTSGIDIRDADVYDYNIHKIHNVDKNIVNIEGYDGSYKEGIKTIFKDDGELPSTLESGITINNQGFLGDIVEFSPYTIEETVLEPVYHRFNTRQRESIDSIFAILYKDEIIYDDYDVETGFTLDIKNKYNCIYVKEGERNFPINIAPEGYYYQPHYRIPLKEYKTTVLQGTHRLIKFTVVDESSSSNNIYNITTDINYNLETNEELWLYHKLTNEKKIGIIKKVSGKRYNEIEVEIKDFNNKKLTDYKIFKPNTEMPELSYDLNDGSGRYLWREEFNDNEYFNKSEISGYTFTNDAHYINKNIIFFLRRQDPFGEYKLSNAINIALIQNLIIGGVQNDYGNIEYINEEESRIC